MRAWSLLSRAASRSRTAGSASNMRRMLRKVLRSRRQGWATKVELSARAAPICGWAASSTVARMMASAQREVVEEGAERRLRGEQGCLVGRSGGSGRHDRSPFVWGGTPPKRRSRHR